MACVQLRPCVERFSNRCAIKTQGRTHIDDNLLPTAKPSGIVRSRGGSPEVATSPMKFVAVVVFIATLYLGREVLIPFVLALLLCFVLVPMAVRLRRWGLGRITSIVVTMILATTMIAGLGSFFAVQLIDVTMRLPEYQGNIEQKIESLRITPNGPIDRAIRMFARLNDGLDKSTSEPKDKGRYIDKLLPPDKEAIEESPPKVTPVQMVAPAVTPMGILSNVTGTALGPLATAGIVFVLVIFLLIEREDLRDRLIRELGTAPGQLNNTTQALDDAAYNVSRFLLMQLIVNSTYGLAIGIGLYFIGVPNPALWGLLATVLRFVPYIGPIIASAFPTALAFAVDPGWGMVIATVVMFVVVELISNNLIETWLYGTKMGISSVAILLSAMFWTWLWGPIGLLMSTPITVCIVVLGRYIPALSGISRFLGDQPGLPLYARMYQRFLAMDPDEPDQIAQEYLTDHTVEEFYGEVLVPALRLLEDERFQDSLEPARREFILEHIRELIDDVAERPDPDKKPAAAETSPSDPAAESTETKDPSPAPDVPIALSGALAAMTPAQVICISAHDESDEVVAQMISILLRRRGIRASFIPAELRAADRVERLATEGAPIACISVLPPYAAVYARHTVQRIAARVPSTKLVVGFWEASAVSENLTRQLTAVGATEVVSSVAQAVASLVALVALEPGDPLNDGENTQPVEEQESLLVKV